MTVNAQCFAKLNLFLDITGRLPNGYHSLNNVTQSVSLADTVTVTAQKSAGFSCKIACDDPDIPTDSRNTAYKAAKAFTEAAGTGADINILIQKRVPVMGGMGGSSVDAAGVIRALNHLLNTRFSLDKLCDISDKVGADTALCLIGGTVISGKGYDRLDIEAEGCFVCVKPDSNTSTADAYSAYDAAPIKANEGFEEFTAGLKDNGLLNMSDSLYNIFERLQNDPVCKKIKADLLSQGAKAAMLTGSGSVIYGVFENMVRANIACVRLSEKYPRVFVCRAVNDGVLLY